MKKVIDFVFYFFFFLSLFSLLTEIALGFCYLFIADSRAQENRYYELVAGAFMFVAASAVVAVMVLPFKEFKK